MRCRDDVDAQNPEEHPQRLWEISDAILNDAHGNSDKIHPTTDFRCAENDVSECRMISKFVRATVTPGFAAPVEWTRLRYPVVVAVMENKGPIWTESRYKLQPLEIGGKRRTVVLIHPTTDGNGTRWTSYHLRRRGNVYEAAIARGGRFFRCDAKTHPQNEAAAAWTGCNGKKIALDSMEVYTGRARGAITHAELAAFVMPFGTNRPFTDEAWITCANGCCEFQD